MLQKLTVKNFALIENATIDLKNGFTVITGETGSGKSILLGALHLILGERADHSVIRDTSLKTIVEAQFNLPKNKLKDKFKRLDLDYDQETIIRREIKASGKSRAFINDTPVQLSVLKQIAEELVYIHSQHHTLELKDPDFQRDILDIIGGLKNEVAQYSQIFKNWKKLKSDLLELEGQKAKSELNEEFNAFQLEELKTLQLEDKDYQSIEHDINRAEEFEDIQHGYQMIAEVINGEGGIAERLGQLKKSITVKDEALNSLLERINSVLIELNDIGAVAENDLSGLDAGNEEIDALVQLMDAFNTALRKHGKQTQEGLFELYQSLRQEVDKSSSIDEEIELLRREIVSVEKELHAKASNLSKKRKKAAGSIEKDIIQLLSELKLANASLEFSFEESDPNESGKDSITLFFQPNKGMAKKRIDKSASGGELSRLMLVIQYLLSSEQELPTLIFDEIDTGVSGEVATKIGLHMSKMGENMQLIAITHLPQVASKGRQHIRVYKTEEKNQTNTYLAELDKQQRIEEIAKLMSGEKVNDAALQNALNLMEE
jgi:DNA repair protein RecN (Recombination protein N)